MGHDEGAARAPGRQVSVPWRISLVGASSGKLIRYDARLRAAARGRNFSLPLLDRSMKLAPEKSYSTSKGLSVAAGSPGLDGEERSELLPVVGGRPAEEESVEEFVIAARGEPRVAAERAEFVHFPLGGYFE